MHPEGSGVRRGSCSIPQLPDQSRLPLQSCPLAGAQGAPGERCAEDQLCAATRKGFGAELVGIFSTKNTKMKGFFDTVEIPMPLREFSTKVLGLLLKLNKCCFQSILSKVCISFQFSCFFSEYFGWLLCAKARVCPVAL